MNRDKFRDKQLKYWRKRNNELHKAVDLEADAVIKTLKQAYKDAENSINQNIAQWYQKLADNNEITLADAKKWLAADELADFKMTLDEYIRHGEELDIDPSWKKAMINASSKHHISSYEAQKMLAQAEIEEAVAKIDGSWIDRAAETAYLHRLYDAQIAKGTMFRAPNTDRAVRSAKRPWTPDGMEFVERAHVNNAKLVQKIHRDLTQAAITGESYETTARRISKDFELTVYESVRIVRTESCHIETEASMQAYRDCGIDQYQILATLDRKTCGVCADMDMQVVNLSDRMDGYNAPPFHPNCRCTTIAYFADMEDDDTTRAGRNEEGRNVPMDGGMNYEDWNDLFGEGLKISSPGNPKSFEKSLESIRKGKAGLSKARKNILNRISESGNYARFEKDKISVNDLAYLSAATGHEFSLFRGKTEDVLFHGDAMHCNISKELSDELISKGYEWVAHSHVDSGPLIASRDDRITLRKLGQEKSIIIGINGKMITFYQSEFY